MITFYYKALNKNTNEIVSGSIEAETIRDAREKLFENGLLATKLTESASAIAVEEKHAVEQHAPKDVEFNASNLRLKMKYKVLFIAELQMMLAASISMLEALDILIAKAKDLNFSRFLRSVRDDIAEGKTFSEALNPFRYTLGNVIMSLCKAGEKSGKLPQTLTRAKNILQKEVALKEKVVKASIYPGVVVFMAVGLIFFFGLYVFPKFQSFGQVDVPPLAEKIIGIAMFCKQYWPVTLLLFSAFLGGLYYFFTSKPVKIMIDNMVLQVPKLCDFVKYVNLSNFFAILSATYESEISIREALGLAASSIKNYPMREKAVKLEDIVARGGTVSDAISMLDFVDDSFVTMIATGEKSGELGQKFEEVTTQVDNRVDSTLDILIQMYDPILKIVIGIIVGFVALGFYQMYFATLFSL